VKIIVEPLIRLLKVFHFYYCNLSSLLLESKITVYEIKINVVVLWTPKSDKNRKLRSIVMVIIEIFVCNSNNRNIRILLSSSFVLFKH
jgi:hypothetical protein